MYGAPDFLNRIAGRIWVNTIGQEYDVDILPRIDP